MSTKIFIKAKPGAKVASITQRNATHFRVCVTAPAKEGKANDAIVKTLAEHLDIPPSRIRLIAGQNYKEKVFEVFG